MPVKVTMLFPYDRICATHAVGVKFYAVVFSKSRKTVDVLYQNLAKSRTEFTRLARVRMKNPNAKTCVIKSLPKSVQGVMSWIIGNNLYYGRWNV